MSETGRRLPPGLDTRSANIARVYDCLLGGKDNFAVDRRTAEALLAVVPEIRQLAEENRAFLRRVVRHLARRGIRQFIDIGVGFPTPRNTHEVAQSEARDARVLYVDKDPVVLCHARALLAGDARTGVAEGDVMHPHELLASDEVRRLIDFDEPPAILICGALQYVPHSDDPYKAVAWLHDALPSGGHLAISHVVFDARPDVVASIEKICRVFLNRPDQCTARTVKDVAPFFDGFELVEPGLVHIAEWRPDIPRAAQAEDRVWMVGGVGRKP